MNFKTGLLFLVMLVPVLSFGDDIPVVGLDSNHESFVRNIPVGEYLNSLKTVFSSVHGSMVPLLENACPLPSKKGGWTLRTVAVGVGAGLEVGLGPIISVNAKARFRMIYTNQRNAVFPD